MIAQAATLEHIGRRALSSAATLQATYDLAVQCIRQKIPGDFVECGVFQGVQCAAMAKACMDLLESMTTASHGEAQAVN